MHTAAQKGLMYVGTAGTGKTTIVLDYFTDVDSDSILTSQVNFNSYTSSMSLQVVIESNVDKRTGTLYGPPTGKTLIYCLSESCSKIHKLTGFFSFKWLKSIIEKGVSAGRKNFNLLINP